MLIIIIENGNLEICDKKGTSKADKNSGELECPISGLIHAGSLFATNSLFFRLIVVKVTLPIISTTVLLLKVTDRWRAPQAVILNGRFLAVT